MFKEPGQAAQDGLKQGAEGAFDKKETKA